MTRPLTPEAFRRPGNPQKPPCEEVLEFVRKLAIAAARRDHELAVTRAREAADAK